MAIEYRRLEANPNYTFIISGLTGGGVSGFYTSEVNINLANSYTSRKEVLSDAAGAIGLGGIADKAFGFIGTVGSVERLAGRSKTTRFETTKVWDGSNIPQFLIDYFFLGLSSDEINGPMDKVKRLQSAVLPSGAVLGGYLRAPLGYKSNGNGTLTLTLGKWFRATRLVMTDMTVVPSKEVMENGRPISVSGTITLEPMEAITYDDLLGYYRI